MTTAADNIIVALGREWNTDFQSVLRAGLYSAGSAIRQGRALAAAQARGLCSAYHND
jgi:hypothetical protein